MRPYWTGVGPDPIWLLSLYEEERHRGEHRVETEAETGGMHPQAKEHPGFLVNNQRPGVARAGPPSEPGSAHLDGLWPSSFPNREKIIVLSHPVCGSLLL